MSIVRHIQFQLWFYMQARACAHMVKLTHWEERFPVEEDNDLFA
jgi:hypothetical protein